VALDEVGLLVPQLLEKVTRATNVEAGHGRARVYSALRPSARLCPAGRMEPSG
jgi:hypothetical protein